MLDDSGLADELDALVARAYGWASPLNDDDILLKLVQLHDECLEDEAKGEVEWVRPEYQKSRFSAEPDEAPELGLPESAEEPAIREWPAGAVDQISAIKASLAESSGSPSEVADRFVGAKQKLVEHHLATLELLGEAKQTSDGTYHPAGEPATT